MIEEQVPAWAYYCGWLMAAWERAWTYPARFILWYTALTVRWAEAAVKISCWIGERLARAIIGSGFLVRRAAPFVIRRCREFDVES